MPNDVINCLKASLDKTSKLPMYQQISYRIKQLVKNGTLKKGAFLPSEREFTELLNVSRITIRKALAHLEQENIVIRAQGYGTVINEKFEYSLKTVKGFSQQIELRGQKPDTLWISKQIVKANQEIAEQLGFEINADVFMLKRIRYIDKEPVSIEESYVPVSLIDDAEQIQLSLYSYFNSKNIFPLHAKSRVSAILPDAEFKSMMKLKDNIPVLVIKQLVFAANNQPIEYSINRCRSDMYVFISEE